MPAHTKKQKTIKRVHEFCRDEKLEIYRSSNVNALIAECWEKIPQSMQKKLNSDDLFDYIRIHVLPGLLKPSLKGMYHDDFKINIQKKERYV